VTERTFAAWLEPSVAKRHAEEKEVLAFARSLSDEQWAIPSGNDGWTLKDVMAHIGKGNDQLFQALLRQVIAGDKIDTEIFGTVDTDGENAEGVEQRKGLTPAQVITEFEEACDEVDDLLSQLTDEQEHLQQDDPPFILRTFVGLIDRESHSIEHLKQMKAALEIEQALQ
jgi:uncharacterized protein (TIGR03083 family)